MKGLAVNLTAYGKPAPPPSHSPWKTLRVSHSLTASTTNISDLTLYRGTFLTCLAPFGTFLVYDIDTERLIA